MIGEQLDRNGVENRGHEGVDGGQLDEAMARLVDRADLTLERDRGEFPAVRIHPVVEWALEVRGLAIALGQACAAVTAPSSRPAML